jgi:ABC-type phosphate transport system substrate-binding protein
VGGTCSGGVNSGANCTSASQCPDVTLAQTQCKRIPLDNISRIMAVNIFSGQAWYWTDFGAWYNADPIVACLRHAGSGTHATLDWAVMRSGAKDWGWPLVTTENAADPTVWFNDGSSDEMKCINTLIGAIGYADADQLEGTDNYPNVHALKYNGVEPRRTKVRNGEYDFYSNQWLYFNRTPTQLEEALISYASNPANIPSTKAKFWATADEMVFNKGDDRVYPGFVGASNPQTP